jgi:branched-chain amino acid transport system ATP-binding protein
MATELEAVAANGRATEALLDVDGVRYAYGDLVAVWDVSFQARAGAVTAIVGRNGAGKTTLMFGLSGVLPATAGHVRLNGLDVTASSTWDRANQGLCLVPEGKRVFADLTVEENISVGLSRAVRRPERAERCAEQFERFPILGEKRSHLAGSLSGGQQQMLAIASALAMHPRVLCVDEPSSGLAPTAVDVVLSTLDDLKREGFAVVLVEQMVEDVVTGIADEVIVIERGRVVMQDVPERISLGDLERLLGVA